MNKNLTSDNIIDVIKMIHLDCEDEQNLEKEWSSLSENKKNYFDFNMLSDHNIFEKRLTNFVDKNYVLNALKIDKSLFLEVFDCFDRIHTKKMLNNQKSEFTEFNILRKLNSDGIVKIPRMFTRNQLSNLLAFQQNLTDNLKSELDHSGYIRFAKFMGNDGRIYAKVANNKTKPNTGMTRLQSKSLGYFHPGLDEVLQDGKLLSIFKGWYINPNSRISRATMDWVRPAPYNHNGWHFDLLKDQLKVMILLSDVSVDNAPMYYAKGTHKVKTEDTWLGDLKHELFKIGLSSKVSKNHCGTPCPVSYLSDDVIDNAPKDINYDPVVFKGSNCKYDKEVCVGEIGDAIVFESNGYHSGNICKLGERRDIVITADDHSSFKNKFINHIGAEC